MFFAMSWNDYLNWLAGCRHGHIFLTRDPSDECVHVVSEKIYVTVYGRQMTKISLLARLSKKGYVYWYGISHKPSVSSYTC